MSSTSETMHSTPQRCPMTSAMRVIGGKWKLLIVYFLADGQNRFSLLRKALPKITAKMLTQQLRELERDGVITRKIYRQIPPKVEYTLTAVGEELLPIIHSLQQWGKHTH